MTLETSYQVNRADLSETAVTHMGSFDIPLARLGFDSSMVNQIERFFQGRPVAASVWVSRLELSGAANWRWS